MNIVKAHARVGYYFDYENDSDKFYKVIVAGPFTVFNYGRRGGPIGQVDIKKHSSEGAARAAADKKWQDKTGPRARDPYTNNQSETTFDLNLDRIQEDKESAKQVVLVYEAASRGGAGVGDPGRGAVQQLTEPTRDRLTLLTQRALDVIELSVAQPAEAMAAYVDLNEEWASLQDEFERVASMVKTADSMVTTA